MSHSKSDQIVMFTTSWEKYPSKPVISSSSAAEAEFQYWLRENRIHEVIDQAGTPWRVEIKVFQGPSPTFEAGSFWRISLGLEAKVTASRLLAGGSFDPELDARLLKMLGDSEVCIKLKPRIWSGRQIEVLRMQVIESLRSLRSAIESQSFHGVKRRVCGEWLDQRCLFK